MVYRFKLPIGDWSGDGHSKCDYYIIESSVPVEVVREAYFDIVEKTGVALDGHDAVCGNYEDSSLSLKWLDSIGLTKEDLGPIDDFMDEEEDSDTITICPENMAHLFLAFLNKNDPRLELVLVHEDLELLQFSGYDSKKRHISAIGYGTQW